MADLNEIDRAIPVKIAGSNPATGITDNYQQVDANGTAQVGLYDSSGNAIGSTVNRDLQADDTTRAAGLDTVITMTGAAIEVKVGASRLTTRKYVIMNPTGNACKWGFTSTTQSFDVFKNGFTFFPAGPNTPIWIIGPSGVTVEIGEV